MGSRASAGQYRPSAPIMGAGEMRVIVTGGRDYVPTYKDFILLRDALWELRTTCVVHGGAAGVDQWAGKSAKTLGFCVSVFPYRGDLGRAGGHVRNQEMVDTAHACIHLTGGAGTADCVRRATKAGLSIVALHPDTSPSPPQQTELF